MLNKYWRWVPMLLVVSNSFAFDYIVFDPKNLAEAQEQYQMLKSQLDEMVQQKNKLETQIGQLDDQYLAITGENDFYKIFEQKNKNGSDFFEWISTLDDLQKSIQDESADPTNELSVKLQEYNEIYGNPNTPEIYVPHKPDSYSAQWQAEQAVAVREGLGVSDMAFDKANGINNYIKKLREESYEIATQKQAQDYGNNIQLYMVTIMNEIMRLQAQQLRLMSVSENETAQINDFNAKFFNTDFLRQGE
jgi:hypothetical protein